MPPEITSQTMWAIAQMPVVREFLKSPDTAATLRDQVNLLMDKLYSDAKPPEALSDTFEDQTTYRLVIETVPQYYLCYFIKEKTIVITAIMPKTFS